MEASLDVHLYTEENKQVNIIMHILIKIFAIYIIASAWANQRAPVLQITVSYVAMNEV